MVIYFLTIQHRYNEVELVTMLANAGANLDLPCGDLQMTPLHMGAYNHNVDMVRELLANGAQPNVCDRWNYTPLMYAAIYYEPFMVTQLFQAFIQYGCDVNYGLTMDENGESDSPNSVHPDVLRSQYDEWYITYMREPLGPTSGTALHLAVQNPHLPDSCIEVLLAAGADVNKRNLNGQTPIVGAILDIFFDYHPNIKGHAQLLLSHGSDVNARDIRGWTPLHYSSQRGSISCMQMLLGAGANCNIPSDRFESPLWILLAHGWQETAKYLIKNGCNINEPIKSTTILAINQNSDICRYGEVLPIEFALCNRYYGIAELLVLCGCHINDRTWLGSNNVNIRHAEFLEFLRSYQEQTKKVSTLTNICRKSIRNHIEQGICVKIEKVQIPQSLKEFICLNSY